jgi:uncharacterized protein (AIM24 family)
MAVPKLLATQLTEEEFAGVRYHIQGELVPVLQVELKGVPIFFEHHILLWKDPGVEIKSKALPGLGKRMLAGMPVFITEAGGPGRIAFSRDGAGHVFPMHLRKGEGIDVREHQWLAATNSVSYTFTRLKGISNIMFGGTGLFIDNFTCKDADGVLWMHGYGNVFDITLAPGEQIDLEPGGWIYKDSSVKMETVFQKLSTGFFAAAGQLSINRFTGPGRLGIQSMYLHFPTAE